MSLCSATKYLNGHGDLIGGVIISNKDFIENIEAVSIRN